MTFNCAFRCFERQPLAEGVPVSHKRTTTDIDNNAGDSTAVVHRAELRSGMISIDGEDIVPIDLQVNR